MRRLVDDHELAVMVLEGFMDESKDLICKIGESLEEGDTQRVKETIHTLKGSSSNVSAKKVSNLCVQVEEELNAGVGCAELKVWLDRIEEEMKDVMSEAEKFKKAKS